VTHNRLCQLLVRWHDLAGLFKVNSFGTKRKGVCDLLLVNTIKITGRILHRFRHDCIALCKNRWFNTHHCHWTRQHAMTSPNLCTICSLPKSTDKRQSLCRWQSGSVFIHG